VPRPREPTDRSKSALGGAVRAAPIRYVAELADTDPRTRPLRALILFWCDPAAIALTMAASAQRSTPERREAQLGSGTERENLHGAAKGKGTSGSNREAESTDAPARGAPPRSGDEAG
jgi:hypothetical protein